MRALLAALVLAACRSESQPPAPKPPPDASPPARPNRPEITDVTDEHYPMPRLPRAKVVLTGTGGKKHAFDVEVAVTRDARTRGLMWRYALADTAGMLFIFPRQQPLSFWMRNTLIPLDMLFIDAQGSVVSIQENAEPRTLSARPSAGPALYVLEVRGGLTAKLGVKPGSPVSFEGITNLVAED